jgi:hypothetical protein
VKHPLVNLLYDDIITRSGIYPIVTQEGQPIEGVLTQGRYSCAKYIFEIENSSPKEGKTAAKEDRIV